MWLNSFNPQLHRLSQIRKIQISFKTLNVLKLARLDQPHLRLKLAKFRCYILKSRRFLNRVEEPIRNRHRPNKSKNHPLLQMQHLTNITKSLTSSISVHALDSCLSTTSSYSNRSKRCGWIRRRNLL
jgi:hypothetical protein